MCSSAAWGPVVEMLSAGLKMVGGCRALRKVRLEDQRGQGTCQLIEEILMLYSPTRPCYVFAGMASQESGVAIISM